MFSPDELKIVLHDLIIKRSSLNTSRKALLYKYGSNLPEEARQELNRINNEILYLEEHIKQILSLDVK